MVNKNIKRIVIASTIIAINIASRAILQFLPNVKPVTALIILSTMYMGIGVGSFVVVGTVLLSGLLFGFGTFMPFQFLAWEIIAIFAYAFTDILKKNKIVFVVYALISGFFFGIVVSLDMLILYNIETYIIYYTNGLLFDVFHAVGNAIFSGVLFVIFNQLEKQKLFDSFIK